MFMSTWLPHEITRTQPYSMGPACGWDSEAMRISPAMGTVAKIERAGIWAHIKAWAGISQLNAERALALCLVAPAHVQRDAQRRGVRGIIMIRPAGLREALERDRRLWTPAQWATIQGRDD